MASALMIISSNAPALHQMETPEILAYMLYTYNDVKAMFMV